MNLSKLISTAGLIILTLLGCKTTKSKPENFMLSSEFKTLYDFKMTSIDGNEIDFSIYKGKKVLIVNVASECGYTPQYKDLQALYEKYGDKLVILGFPANNFGGQEPGSDEEIKGFCQKNYGVTFPMFSKISVTGDDQHPLYQWLSKKELNGWNDKSPGWNFCKYLIDENGNLLKFYSSKVKPLDEEITSQLN
jgi:glutathione peroxidase